MEHTVSGKESNRSSLGASTTSTTNTMDIILRVVRVVIVEHMGNVSDILWMVSKNKKNCIATFQGG